MRDVKTRYWIQKEREGCKLWGGKTVQKKAHEILANKIKAKSITSKSKSPRSSAGIRPVLSCGGSQKSLDRSHNKGQTNWNLLLSNSDV